MFYFSLSFYWNATTASWTGAPWTLAQIIFVEKCIDHSYSDEVLAVLTFLLCYAFFLLQIIHMSSAMISKSGTTKILPSGPVAPPLQRIFPRG